MRPVTKSLLTVAALSCGLGTLSAAPASAAGAPGVLSDIRFCESGGDYTAQNPSSTASGAYQFLDSTWRGLGYSGRAKDAPAATQDAAAAKLFSQYGTSPWVSSSSCWAGKHGSSPSAVKHTSGSKRAARTADVTIAVPNTTASVSDVKLTKAEQAQIDAITERQKTQSWWTPQAEAGKTIRRTVIASDVIATHATAAFDDEAKPASAKGGDILIGHYVSSDWFMIDAGQDKGRFISSDLLTRLDDHRNGQIAEAQLAPIPNALRSGRTQHNAYAALGATKQLIRLNAAFRAEFGHDLSVTEGYRDIATQHAYRASLGPAIAAEPGTSHHGFGLAFDLATPGLTSKASAEYCWMAEHGSEFGFVNPSMTAPKPGQTIEPWHYEAAN